ALNAQPLSVIAAAQTQLETALGTLPNPDGAVTPASARVTPQGVPAPGNGMQSSTPCPVSDTGLFKNLHWPLKSFITPIRDQGRRGTCWAFTAIAALESRQRVQQDQTVNLSEQFLVNKVKLEWNARSTRMVPRRSRPG
ncbi:MAG: hypothetical protein HC933_21710, partial [Pleurocapsa sp. SU_196_0]|nr:hypothetical protein [Pleurocapsa sp. SU_196_0]